jgi:hypothetical protein
MKRNLWITIACGVAAIVLTFVCSGCGSSPIYPELPNFTPDAGEDVATSGSADTSCPPCQNFPPIRCSCGTSAPVTNPGGCSGPMPNIYKITFIIGAGTGTIAKPLGMYLNAGNCAGNYMFSRVGANSNIASTNSYATIGYDSNFQVTLYAYAGGTDTISVTYVFWPVNFVSPANVDPLDQIGIARVAAPANGGQNSAFVTGIHGGGRFFDAQYDAAFIVGWGGIIDNRQSSYVWIGEPSVSAYGMQFDGYAAYVQTPVGNNMGAWVDVLAWSGFPGHPCNQAFQPTGTCPSVKPQPYVQVGSFLNYPSSATLPGCGPLGVVGFHDFVGPENATGDHMGNGLFVGPSGSQQVISSVGGVSGTGWCLGI